MWPQESWPSQELTGGGVGALVAPVFVPPVAIAATNPNIRATIRQAWLPDLWPAQRAAQIASLFAAPVNPPVAYPSRPRSLSTLQGLWPPEQWYAQSESGIASGLAQTQLPAVYSPNWYGDTLLLLVSTWPREDWRAQTGARFAAWIPPPVTAIPTVIRHPEILLWTGDTWGTQSGVRNAAIFAGMPAPPPYVNRSLLMALRSTWLPESWGAQTFPDITGGNSPLTPPLPRPVSQFPISLWPAELWGPQGGTRDASILAGPQLLLFMPYVIGELRDIAVAQLQSLFAPVITIEYVYSGAPPLTVVDQSILRGTLVFPGEAVTLQVSLGRRIGPAPCPIVESIVVCNIPVVLSIFPPNKKVVH